MGETIQGIFFNETTSIDNIKLCTLFWKRILVFERFFSDLIEIPALISLSLDLLKKGNLKIILEKNEILSLNDKIYYNLDSRIHDYVDRNKGNITYTFNTSNEQNKIIKLASRWDQENEELKFILDTQARRRIEDNYLKELYNDTRFAGIKAHRELYNEVLGELSNIVNKIWESQHRNRKNHTYNFDFKNKILINQILSSLVSFIDVYQIPYYQLKFNNFRNWDGQLFENISNSMIIAINCDFVRKIPLKDISLINRSEEFMCLQTELEIIFQEMIKGKMNEEVDKLKEMIKSFEMHLKPYCSHDTLINDNPFAPNTNSLVLLKIPIIKSEDDELDNPLTSYLSYEKKVFNFLCCTHIVMR